ncbi:PREDICTED: cathelicidin-related peptide lutzicidin-like [Crocodylus porosus]|uniref:cathelicidin-related peptide lutzicidin-like n=1 Tax=Crocodylus porosus TaxID=8502 RepID=UPI000938D3DE|nr:PREDICTED: cathelicidin-related peptide lutzicidin-like [Crocodylus porosus]
MQTCWVVLLLPLLGAASTELPTTGTVPPQPTPSYAQALATAVNVYNQGSGVDIAFRVLEAESRDDWDASQDPLRQLEFRLKETECPVGDDQPLDQCGFKDGGVRRARGPGARANPTGFPNGCQKGTEQRKRFAGWGT